MSGDLALRRLHFDPWFCLQDLGAAGKAKVSSTCRCGGWKWLGTECEEKQTHLENYEKLIGKGAVAFLRIHNFTWCMLLKKCLQSFTTALECRWSAQGVFLGQWPYQFACQFCLFLVPWGLYEDFPPGLIEFCMGLGCWISWIRLTSLRNSQVYVTIRGLSMWVGVFSILATSRHWPSLAVTRHCC